LLGQILQYLTFFYGKQQDSAVYFIDFPHNTKLYEQKKKKEKSYTVKEEDQKKLSTQLL
jgi:hypothetical protein